MTEKGIYHPNVIYNQRDSHNTWSIITYYQKNNPETKNMRLASQGHGTTVWELH
jgi:proline dehydrogenase